MNDKFTEFEDYFYKNVDIFHWDLPLEDYDDNVSAAKCAWSCIENLAITFCELYCKRNTNCGIFFPDINEDLGVDQYWQQLEQQWYETQESFHKAILYIPKIQLKIEDCPACAIVKALANFPTLVENSPVKPVATVRMNAIDCYPDIVYMGGKQEISLPCYKIDTEYNEGIAVEERIREMALLHFNFDNFPPLPPWILKKIKKYLCEGQIVVKHIYQLKQLEESHDERNDQDSVEVNKKHDEFIFLLPTAISSAIALRDLIQIRYYYPNVFKENEAKKIHTELITHFESAIENDKFSMIRKFYKRPDFDNLKADYHMYKVYGLLLLIHPDINIDDDSEENLLKGVEQLNKIFINADKTVMQTLKNLQRIKLFDCGIPKPYGDATFQEPNRFFYILAIYWRLCRNLILKDLNLSVGFSPHPLLKLIINIRSRIEICLGKLSDISELTEAKETILHLLDAIVSSEMHEDMTAVPEYTLGLVEKIDISIEQARLQFGSKAYPLTSMEELFIGFMEDAISKYQMKSEIAFNGMLNHVKQTNTEIIKKQEIESLKIKFPDKYKKIQQMYEEGESPDVINVVLKSKKSEPNGEGINDGKEKSVFRKDGDIWKIVFDGNELPPLKYLDGFHYISYLLQRPNEQITPLDLYNATKGRVQTPAGKVAANMTKKHDEHEKDDYDPELSVSSGDQLFNNIDDEAKQQYKKRLMEIREERQEAEENNDQATIERLNRDAKFIEKEMKNSGYDKKKKSSTIQGEKARKNVSRRIKYCIKKIYTHNQILGQYLATNIKTGIKCVYSPAPTNPINWQF